MDRQAGSSARALLRTWASWWKGPEVDFQKIKLEAKGEHQAARPSLRTPSLWPLCLHNPNRPPTPGWFIQSRNLRAAFLWVLPQQSTTGVGLVIDTANSIFRFLLGQPGLRERTLCRCKYTYKGWEMSFHWQGQWPWKLDQAKCVRSNDAILPFLHAFVCPWLMIKGNTVRIGQWVPTETYEEERGQPWASDTFLASPIRSPLVLDASHRSMSLSGRIAIETLTLMTTSQWHPRNNWQGFVT